LISATTWSETVALALAAEQAALGPLGQHGADQVLGHQGVAADVPARLQPGADMGLADALDAVGVVRTVLGGGQLAPMVALAGLGAVHLGAAGEHLAHLGIGADLVVEAVERGVDLGVDHRLGGLQRRPRAVIKPHEGHALVELLIDAHATAPSSEIRKDQRGDLISLTEIEIRPP
jgi:hypothetical protein